MIERWQVYFIVNCRHAKPLPKDKYVVVACFDPNPCGFFINSRVNPFIQNQPALAACEAPLSATDHPFLSHNSWLDCRDILSFRADELSDLRGVISPHVIPTVVSIVQACPVLRNRFKKLITL